MQRSEGSAHDNNPVQGDAPQPNDFDEFFRDFNANELDTAEGEYPGYVRADQEFSQDMEFLASNTGDQWDTLSMGETIRAFLNKSTEPLVGESPDQASRASPTVSRVANDSPPAKRKSSSLGAEHEHQAPEAKRARSAAASSAPNTNLASSSTNTIKIAKDQFGTRFFLPSSSPLPEDISLVDICRSYPNHLQGDILRRFQAAGWQARDIQGQLTPFANAERLLKSRSKLISQPWSLFQKRLSMLDTEILDHTMKIERQRKEEYKKGNKSWSAADQKLYKGPRQPSRVSVGRGGEGSKPIEAGRVRAQVEEIMVRYNYMSQDIQNLLDELKKLEQSGKVGRNKHVEAAPPTPLPTTGRKILPKPAQSRGQDPSAPMQGKGPNDSDCSLSASMSKAPAQVPDQLHCQNLQSPVNRYTPIGQPQTASTQNHEQQVTPMQASAFVSVSAHEPVPMHTLPKPDGTPQDVFSADNDFIDPNLINFTFEHESGAILQDDSFGEYNFNEGKQIELNPSFEGTDDNIDFTKYLNMDEDMFDLQSPDGNPAFQAAVETNTSVVESSSTDAPAEEPQLLPFQSDFQGRLVAVVRKLQAAAQDYIAEHGNVSDPVARQRAVDKHVRNEFIFWERMFLEINGESPKTSGKMSMTWQQLVSNMFPVLARMDDVLDLENLDTTDHRVRELANAYAEQMVGTIDGMEQMLRYRIGFERRQRELGLEDEDEEEEEQD